MFDSEADFHYREAMNPKEKQVAVRLTAELHAKLDRLAVAEGRMVTNSEMIRRLIERAPEPGFENAAAPVKNVRRGIHKQQA